MSMSIIPHRLYLLLAIAGVLLLWFSGPVLLLLNWQSMLAFLFMWVGLQGWRITKEQRHD